MTKRRKYKVCGRLGYNGRMRAWFGKKRKWQKAKLFREGNSNEAKGKLRGSNGVQVVNPGRSVSNEERRKGKGEKRGGKSRVRMKDEYRSILMRRKGRQRRYGGVKMEKFREDRKKQRRSLKESKKRGDRERRKGRRKGNLEAKASRLSKVETRVDVRRWRSGRVPTLQMGRDLIEHGKIQRVNEEGEKVGKVKWQGKRRNPGEGREVERETWKTRKGKAKAVLEVEEYEKQAGKYMEVDYVTGRRYMYRRPKSGEVVRPKGRKLSRRV